MMTFHSNTVALISIPIISALIGYITNFLAVRMLFRPHKPVKVLGFTFHGLVPKRQKEIAESLGRMIERDLVSHKDFEAVLLSKETGEEATAFLNEQIDGFATKLAAQNPMVGAFLQGPLLDQVKQILSTQISDKFPQLLSRIVGRMENGLDIKGIVQSKVEAFDLGKLEEIIQEVSNRELKTIELLGGVLGFLVGVGQVVVMAWL